MDERKIKFILNYDFPLEVKEKFIQEFDFKDLYGVIELGLKEFYLASLCAIYKRKSIDIPNTIVDKLWHIHIFDTKEYDDFFHLAFGCKLHHKIYPSNTSWDTKSENYANLLACLDEISNSLYICSLSISNNFGKILLSTPNELRYNSFKKNTLEYPNSIQDLTSFYMILYSFTQTSSIDSSSNNFHSSSCGGSCSSGSSCGGGM